jgi:hypothetical protein
MIRSEIMTHIFDEFSIDQEADSITPPMRTAGRVAYQKFFEETDVVGVRAIDAAVQAIYAAMEAARPPFMSAISFAMASIWARVNRSANQCFGCSRLLAHPDAM